MFELILLLSCSDLFLNVDKWQPGLRGMPNHIEIVPDGISVRMTATGADPYKWNDDMVRTYPRPLLRAERPLVRLWLWIPPFDELPTGPNIDGTFHYFGFRCQISDQYPRLVWPGIFIGRDSAGPCFISRVLVDTQIAPITIHGWWTLMIGWREDGLTQFYASPGRVEEPALVAQDDYEYPTYMTAVNGPLISLAHEAANPEVLTPAFVLNWMDMRAQLPMPMLLPSRAPFAVTLAGGYPSEPYDLEYSSDLTDWTDVGTIRDGEMRAAAEGFWRASHF